jgi:succinyl-diaminopimelate desuccinylase
MTELPDSGTLRRLAMESREEWLGLCRRLIQIPSLPGQEGDIARCIATEMERLQYDRVWTDEVGNVIGRMKGGRGRSLMFNGHMDHVDPGPVDHWPFPPYEAHLDDTWLWGRGASDMKAPLGLQIYAPALLRRVGYELPGDCYVTGVVYEEIGGLGTRRLIESVRTDMAVIGEATSNQIALGHRGRLEMNVHFTGRSVHASVPERGQNPHYSAARFLLSLQALPMADDPFFGHSTAAPTLYRTDQSSANVTPGEVTVIVDWRNVPGESPDSALQKVRDLLPAALEEGVLGAVQVGVNRLRTYTGYETELSRVVPGLAIPADHWLVRQALATLERALGRPVTLGKWQFATDGPHLAAVGIPTIGFSPASELYPHTTQDRIELEAMVEGLIGYMALALELGMV